MTVTCSPTYPVAGDAVTIAQTILVGASNVSVASPSVTLTSVPPNSELPTGELFDAGGNRVQFFTADVPGDYALKVVAFTEYAAAPSYDGDGVGDVRSVVRSSETFTVRVGDTTDLEIAAIGHSLTVRLAVHNGIVTDASLVLPTTDKAYAASQDSTVVTKLTALETLAATSIGPALATAIGTFATKYNAHRTDATAHPAGSGRNDTVNVFSPTTPYDLTQTIAQLNQLRAYLANHLTGASTSTIVWHAADDTKNIIVAPHADGLDSAMVLYADMWRVFEAHRTQTAAPAAHPGSDTANALGTIDKLSDLISTVLVYFANGSPTVPTGLEDGLVQLESLYGFRKAS